MSARLGAIDAIEIGADTVAFALLDRMACLALGEDLFAGGQLGGINRWRGVNENGRKSRSGNE